VLLQITNRSFSIALGAVSLTTQRTQRQRVNVFIVWLSVCRLVQF